MSCACCGSVFHDPSIPHYCELVRQAVGRQQERQEDQQDQQQQQQHEQEDQRQNQHEQQNQPRSSSAPAMGDAGLGLGSPRAGWGEAGNDGGREPAPGEEDLDVGRQENIKVVVRVRPLLAHEAGDGRQATTVVELADARTLKVVGKEPRHKLQCRFDAVFGGSHAQEEVYQHVKECTTAVVEGFNATVFAYGQTGSGKVRCERRASDLCGHLRPPHHPGAGRAGKKGKKRGGRGGNRRR